MDMKHASFVRLDEATIHVGSNQFGPFNLTINHGESIAILGPSGAGKSTLLKMMAKEHAPSSGDIFFLEKNLKLWPIADLSLHRAVLPQSFEIAFDFPVELIISLGRVSHKHDPQQQSIIQQSAKLAQCEHLLHRRFDTLSGGEKARVQLARIFAQLWDTKDGLLLVDEPIAALDPGLQADLLDGLNAYTSQRNHTLVTVLHDINHALMHFNRLLLIKEGQLLGDFAADLSVIPALEKLYGIQLETLKAPSGDFLVKPVRKHTPLTAVS